MKIEKHICDIDGCGKDAEKINKSFGMSVIFTTEQTEGRSVDPYIQHQQFDICADCHAKILTGQAVYAHGAQGYNTFYFKK